MSITNVDGVVRMKTIYSTGAFGEPYRVEVSDDLLIEIRMAQHALCKLPWNGEMFLPVPATLLNTEKFTKAYLGYDVEIVVGKVLVSICVSGPEGRETLLDLDDDLLEIPDVYVSREFEIDLSEHIFSLSLCDIDLIATWKALKEKNKENN